MLKKVLICIITWNNSTTIKDCLSSVEGSNGKSFEIETVVVDNASSDSTAQLVEKNYPKIKLIKNPENLGFGRANNLGVAESKSDYIFFLNPDAVVKEDTIEKLGSYLESNQEVGVVGPKLLNSDGTVQKEMSSFPTVISEILVLLRLHRFEPFKKMVYPNYDYSKPQEVEHLMGSALMIPRNVFEKVGGFDENFFLWFEETDLLKRIKEAGYKIVYQPRATVTHLVGQSTKQVDFLKRQTVWNQSLLYYFKKHHGWFKTSLLLPFMILSYIPATLKGLLSK